MNAPDADQMTADIMAYVQTLDPAEATHEMQHVLGALVDLAQEHVHPGPAAAMALLLGGIAQGLTEQIITRPGGVTPAPCAGGAHTVIGVIHSRLAREG